MNLNQLASSYRQQIETNLKGTSMPKPTQPKPDRFKALAEKRVNRALKAIELVGNLKGMTEAQAGAIVNVLQDAVKASELALTPREVVKLGFKLLDGASEDAGGVP